MDFRNLKNKGVWTLKHSNSRKACMLPFHVSRNLFFCLYLLWLTNLLLKNFMLSRQTTRFLSTSHCLIFSNVSPNTLTTEFSTVTVGQKVKSKRCDRACRWYIQPTTAAYAGLDSSCPCQKKKGNVLGHFKLSATNHCRLVVR
jgi:hypothetical protein